MTDVFVVMVEGNLVNSIQRRGLQPDDLVPASSLEVGTQLATSFRQTGRIDGTYLFANADGARTFASLCLQFMKALIEQRSRHIDALPAGFDAYRAEQQGRGPGTA